MRPPLHGVTLRHVQPLQLTKGQQAIGDLAGAMRDLTGNLPMLPGIFPDYSAPIARTARWTVCANSPWRVGACRRRRSHRSQEDRSWRHHHPQRRISPHWRRWLGVESRCIVPFTSFETTPQTFGGRRWWFVCPRTAERVSKLHVRLGSRRKGRGYLRPIFCRRLRAMLRILYRLIY